MLMKKATSRQKRWLFRWLKRRQAFGDAVAIFQ